MKPRRRHLAALAGAAIEAVVALHGGAARAQQSSDPCLTTPLEGQKLRRADKLLAARDAFAVCSRKTCPSEIVRSCMRWGAEVEGALPSVVLAARDAQGHDLVDVRISIDGKPPGDAGARAIPLDPGPHRFVFRHAGDADVEQRAVLREGEKNREILAVFGSAAGTATPAALPSAEGPSGGAADRPVSASVWILGGVGVLALGSFATFGALGLNERNADGCASGCTQAQYDSFEQKFLVADISLGAGALALGAATWLYLARPAVERRAAAWFDLRPAPGGALGVIGERF